LEPEPLESPFDLTNRNITNGALGIIIGIKRKIWNDYGQNEAESFGSFFGIPTTELPREFGDMKEPKGIVFPRGQHDSGSEERLAEA